MKYLVIIISLQFLIFSNVSLQGQWQQTNGPYGGVIGSFTINGNNIYAGGSFGKIFLSTNSGQNWKLISAGLSKNIYLRQIASTDNYLFAASDSGIFLTTDNGSNWTSVNNGLAGNAIYSIMVNGTNIFAGSGHGVFISTNYGASWNNAGLNTYIIKCFAAYSNKIYAGTDQGMFSSTNNGVTWISTGFYSPVNTIAFNGSYIFSGTDNGIYYSTNNGTSWNLITSGINNITTLLVTSGKIFAATGGGVILSTNNGLNWTYVNNGLPGFTFITALTLYGNNLIASGRHWGTYDAGIFISSDNGSSWNPICNGFINTAIYCLSVDSNKLYAGTSGGIFSSSDEGNEWTRISDYMDTRGVLINGDTIFAAVPNNGVFRSTDKGLNWIRANNGIPNMFPDCFVLCNNILYTGSGGVYRSTDNGLNWTSAGLTGMNIYTLMNKDNALFAGTEKGIYFLPVNGAIWNLLNNGLPAINFLSLTFSDSNIFAGTSNGIYRSINNGTNWTLSGLSGYRVSSVQFSNNAILAGTEKGLFISTDTGLTWQIFNDGLSSSTPNIYSMVVKDGEIYAGTVDDGVWKRADSDIIPVDTPVELESFNGYSEGNKINLFWKTATEKNNYGFYLERKPGTENWLEIAYLKGNGTTSERMNYNYTDNLKELSYKGIISYRLRQVDFDGSSSYSGLLEIKIDLMPKTFSIFQNYPNPFNPSTTISYSLPTASNVKLIVYNTLGQAIKTIESEYKTAGNYTVNFNASDLSSGIYFYKLEAGQFTQVKKMMLIK